MENWSEILGMIGSLVLIISYSLLQLGKLKTDQLNYALFNAIGAGLILISLLNQFNLAAFIIEIFWLLISLLGIIRYLNIQKQSTSKRLQRQLVSD